MEKKNRLYDQFDTKQINEFTADNLDSFRDQIFIQESNEIISDDLIRTGILSNQLSSAGPIVGTMDVYEIEVTSSGSGVAKFLNSGTAPAGQIWQVYSFGISPSGVSGTVSYEVRIFGASGTSTEFLSGSSSLNSSFPLQEDFGPCFIGEGAKIQFEATGTFTSCKLKYCAVRVR